MKHKNILLVVFFLTLFVFQQVQAGETMPPNNPPQINPAPSNVGILYNTLYVYVYWLVPADDPNNPGAILNPPTQCEWPTNNYGCGSESPDPTLGLREPEGFFHVREQYYLRNVLPNEMDFAEIAPDPDAEALQAQAIAARTFASYKSANFPEEIVGVFHVINNSTQFQVFIPGTYNTYPNYQTDIDTALNATQGQFLSAGDGHTIDAEFSSDIIGQSVDGNQNYLKPVQEPISSSTCNLSGVPGNGWGMSQRGAIRWARGNTCPDGTGAVWPVKWDHKQILVHYYTGIDIVDDASGNKVAPDDRWNLLWHNAPAEMTAGQPYDISLKLQNTSTWDWTGNAILGWQWTPNSQGWQGNIPLTATQGETIDQAVSIVAPSANGTYTLHLDVGRAGGSWFSSGWPDAEIPVAITGASATPTPISPPGQTISIPISLGSDDGGTNPGDCVFSNTDNEVYLGACFNGGDITSGFRFQNVPIPPNANIENAYIRFTVDGQYTAPIHVQIDAEASGNPLTYSASCSPRT